MIRNVFWVLLVLTFFAAVTILELNSVSNNNNSLNISSSNLTNTRTREVVYPISWYSNAPEKHHLCGGIRVINEAQLTPHHYLNITFPCNLGMFTLHLKSVTGSDVYAKSGGSKVKCEPVEDGFICNVSCDQCNKGKCVITISSPAFVEICTGQVDSNHTYCDWANNENCNCSNVDYCYPPYLTFVKN